MPTPFRTDGSSTHPDVQNRLDHIEAKVDRVLTIIEGDANNTSSSMVSRLAVAEYKLMLLGWACGLACSSSVIAVVSVVVKFVFSGGFAAGVK